MTWNSKSLLCCAALLAAACTSIEPRTQVMLIADADETVRGQINTLQIQIEGSLEGSTAADATTYMASFDPKDPAGSGWPYRFAMTPKGDAHGRRYKIKLSALDAENKTLAVLRNEGGFVKGKTLALSMRFEASCLGDSSLTCPETDTCASGRCVNASVDPRGLPKLSEIDGGTLPPTGTVNEPVAAAGSGGAGAGGMSSVGGMGSIQTGTSDCGDGVVGPGEQCDTAIRDAQGACPGECPPQPDRPCETLKLEGSGCQMRCTGTPITALVPEDGCCPSGADSNSDNDCQAQCGNGKIEKGETCDPPGTCPTIESCVAADACLRPVIVGAASSCDAVCVMEPIDQCVAGDKCCPSNCTHMTDSDCSPSCGDGKIDTTMGETCEPGNQTMPCRTNCNDNEPCSRDVLTGSVANCNTRCTHVTISTPFPLDGCCPRGANANNDTDCAPACGNGIVELGERCDGASCPEQCDDGNSCTRDTLSGRDCSRQCNRSNIGANTNGKDGCCPGGANALTDSDCPPVCGNGAIEGDELCDGVCPNQQRCNDNDPCTRDSVMGSDCQRKCVNTPIGPNPNTTDGCCPAGLNRRMDADCDPAAPVCGNEEVETGELCDGNCPTQQSCNDNKLCTRDEVSGPGPCQLKCTNTPINASTGPKDECCPTNNERWQDSDCDPRCGNGHKEADEECDGNDCPTAASCKAINACTALEGSGCERKCKPNGIPPNPTTPDGCCPSGLDRRMDADCDPLPPMCGNGVKETGEKCDGDCPTPASCNDDKPCTADVITGTDCQRECEHNTIGPKVTPADFCCPPGKERWEDVDCDPRCGNGHVEALEDCEPPNTTTCDATCNTIVVVPPRPDGGLPQ